MSFFRIAALSLFACAVAALSGCSASFAPDLTHNPATSSIGTIRGSLYGGRTPISSGRVFLFAAGTGGNAGPGIAAATANKSTSLLTSSSASGYTTTQDNTDGSPTEGDWYVTSDANGAWGIGGEYTCAPGTQVYIYAVGGIAITAGSNNSAIGMLAALGQCPVSGTMASVTPFVSLNEITTVSAAYAFAGYATDAVHVSSDNTAQSLTGIANAFASSNELVNIATGMACASTPETVGTGCSFATDPFSNGTVDQQTIDALANSLAACVNSTGPTSVECGANLFNAVMSNGGSGTTATDTATEAIYIAHNPGVGVPTTFGNVTAMSPWQPSLSSTPNDWTIGISFSDSSLNTPGGIAIDGAGNVWVANQSSPDVSKLNGSTGIAISPAGGYTGGGLTTPQSIAIDGSGNAWVTNTGGGNNISEFDGSTGNPLSPSPSGYTGGGLGTPFGIAIDGTGNAWVTNANANDISEFYGSNAAFPHNPGDPISSSSGYTGGGVDASQRIAIDASGNAWVVNSVNHISEFSGVDGSALSPSGGYTLGGLNGPFGVAIDGSGNVWVADQNTGNLSKFYGSNAVLPNTPGEAISGSSGYSGAGGGVSFPQDIAIDGSGNVWVANDAGPVGNVSEFQGSTGNPISGSNGYTGGSQNGSYGIAVDPSGNVWVANSNSSTITELIGAATPVVTPLASGVKNHTLGMRP